jgi:uncharacterized protein YyaL (SSP411 family)
MIFRYVLRDMRDPDGGFYSAEDADSEGEEGLFYVWKPAQVVDVLGDELGALFNEVYGVTEQGNFEHSTSILHLRGSLQEAAKARGEDPERFGRRLSDARERLLEVRSKRIRPIRDDKIITAWNALMISSLAYGAQVLDDSEYRQAAERAAGFILEKLRTRDGRLLRRYRDGQASFPGYIDDYAFFVLALLDLYEATFKPVYLAEAIKLAGKMDTLFWDREDGGFTFRGTDGEALLVQQKETYDGAVPSGNSVAGLALLRIGSLTAEPAHERRGREVLEAFSSEIARLPSGHTQMLIALDFALGPTVEIVLAGEPGSKDTQAMLRAIHDRFLPNKVVALRPEGRTGEEIAALAPFLADQRSIDGKATAYVCRNHACSFPTTDPAEMLRLMEADGRSNLVE